MHPHPCPPQTRLAGQQGTLPGPAAPLCGRRFPAQVPRPDVEDGALQPPSDPATLSNGFPRSSRLRSGTFPRKETPAVPVKVRSCETVVLGPVRPPPPGALPAQGPGARLPGRI